MGKMHYTLYSKRKKSKATTSEEGHGKLFSLADQNKIQRSDRCYRKMDDWVCTRQKGHIGAHVACSTSYVCAVYSEEAVLKQIFEADKAKFMKKLGL